MALVSNDPSWWPFISGKRQFSYCEGSWRTNIPLDNVDGGFIVASLAVVIYDCGAQDNVYGENY